MFKKIRIVLVVLMQNVLLAHHQGRIHLRISKHLPLLNHAIQTKTIISVKLVKVVNMLSPIQYVFVHLDSVQRI